ncbi:MAG TPA: hypothetical protein VFL64_15020 [Rhizobacter sp.]|nr:hypothetical protein [Rhizobacter sp.]
MRPNLAWMLLALCGLAYGNDEAERAQIRQQRQAIETQYAQQQETCRKQFVVTSCLDKARLDRVKALKPLREQEATLDDARRRERAQAHSQRMAEKAKEAEEREAGQTPRSPKPAKAASAPAPAKKPSTKVPAVKASAPDRSAEEQRKREAYEARQREIEAHREEVEKRNAERAARKPPTPLPVPASAGRP